jgi:predicted phage terminase large subunit-like protein
LSLIERLRALPPEERKRRVMSLSEKERLALRYDWQAWARPSQRYPRGDWDIWLLMAGRGFGKTRVGAEFCIRMAQQHPRIALAGRTAADVRDVMVKGESGILACSPPWFFPSYQPSNRCLVWPNGSIATTFSADEPDQARGPQHYAGWFDELAAWRYLDAFDQLMLGMRLGKHPRVCITTTPRPLKILHDLVADDHCHVTTGSTYENVDNLAPAFKRRILSKYEGTAIGEQELHAVLLSEARGALWKRAMFENCRRSEAPSLSRIVVAVDPAVSANDDSDETAIVVAGLGADGHAYVLEDLSGRYSPSEWARRAVGAYHGRKADRIIAESNQGGDLVASNIRTVDDTAAVRLIHASKGKVTRAEPVAALYEQGRVHHVGVHREMEDQCCQYVPGQTTKSPDRMDALAYAITDLMLGPGLIAAAPSTATARRSTWR